MKAINSIVLASGFASVLISAVALDSWLLNPEPQQKDIVIDNPLLERVEPKTSITATTQAQNNPLDALPLPAQAQQQLEDLALVEQVLQAHEQGHVLFEQDKYQNAKLAQQHRILSAHIEQLQQQKAYLAIIQLLKPLTSQERIELEQQFSFAIALSRTKQSEHAIAAYNELLRAEPNNQAASINLGLLLNKTKQYQQAIIDLKQAVAISSGERKAKALSLLATAYQHTEQLKLAELTFKHSIEYRPQHAATWLKLAMLQAKLDMPYATVDKSFRRAVALKKDYKKALASYGRYQLFKLNFDGAFNNLAAALQQASNDETIQRDLAWAYWHAERHFDANQLWRRLASKSNQVQHRLLAAHISAAIKQQNHNLKPLIDKDDQSRYWLANIAAMQNQSHQARLKLETIKPSSDWYWLAQLQLAKLPPTPIDSDNLSTVYSVAEKLSQLAQANIHHAHVQYALAHYWFNQKQTGKALRVNKKLITQMQAQQTKSWLYSKAALLQLQLLHTLKQHDAAVAFFANLPTSLQQQTRFKRFLEPRNEANSAQTQLSQQGKLTFNALVSL